MSDDVEVTPTEELVLEVLAARYRLGEQVWTFSARPAISAALRRLTGHGLINFKAGIVERTHLAWLTEAGRAESMSSNYVPPAWT